MSAPLAALTLRAAHAGSAHTLADDAQRLGVDDVLGRVELIARRLCQAGVRTLAIAADNSTDWVLTDLAAQYAGVVVVPLPPFFTAAQVRHVLTDCGADAIAADCFGSAGLKSLPTRFSGELTRRLSLLRLDPLAATPALIPGTAKISYTSGTTGTPKGVCLSQRTLDRVAVGLREATRNLALNRHLCLLPLATLLENVAGVHAPLLAGAEVLLPSLARTGLAGAAGLDVALMLDCIREYEPNSLILLPQMLAGLVGAVERGASLPLSLRFAAVGGGVVGLPLLERADRAGLPVFEGYGLTECGSVVALNTPTARRLGSVGRVLPHAGIRIGQGSEVLVHGAVLSAYLGDRQPWTGPVATGDVGYLDADGYLFINGRRKNVMITSFGRNLSPEWVEASLAAAASIGQAALFGDAMPWNVAVVVPAGAASVDDIERDIAAVNRGLPDYARVSRFILASAPFTPEHGTATANGRLRRTAIGQRYRHEIAACYAEPVEHYA